MKQNETKDPKLALVQMYFKFIFLYDELHIKAGLKLKSTKHQRKDCDTEIFENILDFIML